MMGVKKFSTYLTIILLVALSGCRTVDPNILEPRLSSEEVLLKDLCQKYDIELEWDNVTQIILLRGENLEARTMVGSNIVIIGERQEQLSGPIRIENSSILVPIDFQKLLVGTKKTPQTKVSYHASFSKKIPSLRTVRTVVVDAGHGGKDPGAISRSGLQEKEVVLDIAKRVATLLKQKGFRVILTRDNDTFIPLDQRTEMASTAEADVFVSIHANANPSRSVNGMEIYMLNKLGFSEKNEDQRKMNYQKYYRSLQMKRGDEAIEEIISDLLDANKQPDSMQLAERISYQLHKEIKTKDLGLKKARFFVLRNTLIPAVLVEVGFLSNPKEEDLLKTKKFRQKAAEGIAQGIIDYARM